jgi:hypothetical protein
MTDYKNLGAFYRDLLSEKLVKERKEARAAGETPSPREPFEGPVRIPYSKHPRHTIKQRWVVGQPIPNTVYRLLRGPFKMPVGRYPKRFVEVLCLCNRVRVVRCDNILRGESQACRSCAAKLRWARHRKRNG